MTEREAIGLLQEAVRMLETNSMGAVHMLLQRVEAESANLENGAQLRGEMLLLRLLAGMVDMENAGAALQQAQHMMQGTQDLLVPGLRELIRDYNAYRLWGRGAGRASALADRGEAIRGLLAPLEERIGFEVNVLDCFLAQLAYYRGEFEKAQKLASSVFLASEAASSRPNLSAVHAMEILSGVGRHTVDQALWRKSRGYLQDVISGARPASRDCAEQAGVICAIQDMALGYLHDVPSWLRTGDFGAVPVEWGFELVRDNLLACTLPSAMMAAIEYFAFNSEPVHALNVAATMRDVFNIHLVVLDAYIDIMRAGCFFQLDKPYHARKALEAAMESIAPDGLWLIAAEFAGNYGEALYSVAREFDPDAPEKIRHIGEGYMNKLTPLRNELMKGPAEALTKREQEIAALVMKGYSNSEIAVQLNVTVRTVRFHLENVYSKLNISGRSKLLHSIDQGSPPRLANWMK